MNTATEAPVVDNWQQWLQHPERLRFREFLFQVHLWVGAIAAPYVFLMSTFGRCYCFSQRVFGSVLPGVARKSSWLNFGRRYRPHNQWNRGNLRDPAMCNGRGYMVAWNKALETQPVRQLARAFPTNQLGSAQRPRVLVPSVFLAMGNLRHLSIAS
jgi:hypothetical protein